MILELVDSATVGGELRRLGYQPVRAGPVPLPGGVSNRVFLSETTRGRVIVKQSVERLMVADEWLAPRARIIAEAQAMQKYHVLAPQHTPQPLHIAPDDFYLVMTAAPDDWTDWKTRLRAGTVEVSLARRIAECLADLHLRTRSLPEDAIADGASRFRQLRIDPYFETTAERRPAIAAALRSLSEEIGGRRDCLVHGDFSPKNLLTDGTQFWLIDFEVAHVGDPSFDVAFLASHLLLKAAADPANSARLRQAADAFVTSYLATVERRPGDPHLGRVVAALLAARVDGRSPVDYLDEEQRDRTRRRSAAWLRDPDGFWAHLEEARG